MFNPTFFHEEAGAFKKGKKKRGGGKSGYKKSPGICTPGKKKIKKKIRLARRSSMKREEEKKEKKKQRAIRGKGTHFRPDMTTPNDAQKAEGTSACPMGSPGPPVLKGQREKGGGTRTLNEGRGGLGAVWGEPSEVRKGRLNEGGPKKGNETRKGRSVCILKTWGNCRTMSLPSNEKGDCWGGGKTKRNRAVPVKARVHRGKEGIAGKKRRRLKGKKERDISKNGPVRQGKVAGGGGKKKHIRWGGGESDSFFLQGGGIKSAPKKSCLRGKKSWRAAKKEGLPRMSCF